MSLLSAVFFLAASMKKKIILRRIFHRNEWRYAIIFEYDRVLTDLVKSISNVSWSKTNRCWYAAADETKLKQILTVFREKADIDITEIVSGEKEEVIQPETFVTFEKEPERGSPVKHKAETPVSHITIPEVKNKKGVSKFSPVIFTINETDGRLVVKFTGRYNREWIKELNGYGKAYYDAANREWLLKWSQLAVDSLPDYFSSRGVELIVKKPKVSDLIKVKRGKQGSEIRKRILSEKQVRYIDELRSHLEEKRYSRRTIESYTAHLELFFKYFNDKDPDEIRNNDISEFIEDHILKSGYSSSYQNIIISAIKMFYTLNGMRRVGRESFERPRRSRALPKVFSKEEVMKIFGATRNSKHKLMLWLIYSCGLRRSEVINIKLTDLDSDRGILNIREGKGNTDRMVPIPQKVWEKIRAYINNYMPVTYLFEGQTGGRYSVESVYSVFKQSLRRAGIKKDVGVHCLRHSYATHLHESGLDIRYIQELLGHKSIRTTEIYTHVSRRNLFAIRSPIEDMDLE